MFHKYITNKTKKLIKADKRRFKFFVNKKHSKKTVTQFVKEGTCTKPYGSFIIMPQNSFFQSNHTGIALKEDISFSSCKSLCFTRALNIKMNSSSFSAFPTNLFLMTGPLIDIRNLLLFNLNFCFV